MWDIMQMQDRAIWSSVSDKLVCGYILWQERTSLPWRYVLSTTIYKSNMAFFMKQISMPVFLLVTVILTIFITKKFWRTNWQRHLSC